MTIFHRRYLFKWWTSYCYVNLQGCNCHVFFLWGHMSGLTSCGQCLLHDARESATIPMFLWEHHWNACLAWSSWAFCESQTGFSNSWESTSPLPSLSSNENLKHLDKNMISYSDRLDMLNFSRGTYRILQAVWHYNVKYNKTLLIYTTNIVETRTTPEQSSCTFCLSVQLFKLTNVTFIE